MGKVHFVIDNCSLISQSNTSDHRTIKVASEMLWKFANSFKKEKKP